MLILSLLLCVSLGSGNQEELETQQQPQQTDLPSVQGQQEILTDYVVQGQQEDQHQDSEEQVA